ncbi:MAG: FHA domain-containing protein [Verrucomicrobiota bacterium]|nr:FHA domain-containing protein [Verrucomicrobiota bacterium]
MAKLVILTQSLAGRAHELTTERTTIGRVEDNAFQIAEPSVSSHHCEVMLRGDEVVVKDSNSTNGTFIAGEKISEGVLKPGQTLRLGNVELRLENGAPAAPGAPAPAPPKKSEPAKTVSAGVRLDQLEQGGRAPMLDTVGGFSKKSNQVNRWFWIVAVIIGVVILGLLLFVFTFVPHNNAPRP